MRSVHCISGTDGLDRRTFLRLAGYGSLGVLAVGGSGDSVFAGQIDPAGVTKMTFDVSYRTAVNTLPRDAEEVHVWMPLPPSDEAQEIHDLTITCPLPYRITIGESYANRMIHVETDDPQPFVLESRYRVVRHRAGSKPGPLDEALARKYLRLTSRVRVTDEVAAFTRRVVGKAGQPVEVGRRIYDAMIEVLTYDKEIAGCGTGDTAWIMKHKRGKCDDYHALFMAMMVSQGIPVRWEQGFPLPYPSDEATISGQLSGDCSGAHCWASFYDPDLGWVPVDVSEADKRPELRDFFFGHLTPNRFKISEGRSIVLNPPQGADALSTFAFAYAEADGIPLIYHSNYDNTVQFNITHVEKS